MEKAKATLDALTKRVNRITRGRYTKPTVSTARAGGKGSQELLKAIAWASIELLEEQAEAERKAYK